MHQWTVISMLAGVLAVGGGVSVTAIRPTETAAPAGHAAALAGTEAQPAGKSDLGSVAIPRRVMADGRPLSAGTYQIRLTADSAQPEAAGQTPSLSRWVEFVQGGEVRGREVVSIVPSDEIGDVAGSAVPGPGASRVEVLKENEYLRIWINQTGTHYLIHLPIT